MTDKLQEIVSEARKHFFGGLVLLTASKTLQFFTDLDEHEAGRQPNKTWELGPEEMESLLRQDLIDVVV